MEYSERRSNARGLYPTQDTSHMRTARVKQEEEADIRIRDREQRNVGTIKGGKVPKQDLTVMLHDDRDSPIP